MQFFISTRNKDILNLHFTIPFFLIILFLKLSTAKLTVYDTNNVISSYDNVDFMGIDKTSYGTVMGKLLVASFSGPIDNDKDDPCKIKNLPLDAAIDIVVIPFQDAYDIGCESYSQIIIANNWKLNKNEVLTYPPNKAPTGGNNNEPNDNTDNGNINNNNNNNYNNNNNQVKNPPPQENQNANPKVINNDNNNINNIPNGKGVNGNVNNNNNNVNNNLNNNVNAKNNNNIPPPNNNNDIPNAAPKNNNNNNVNNGE
ncbi:hypothetical protein RCL_jg19143.t1 [Rhizophagus clarus]|uniref:Uncharacterized protein n=1 Tax=Rhizophagus clarus TaxID=94130 RepID=A0A8H3QZH2_9GLOM|nr:hypothetical protein RCL_jg19143.t1 [Rhizophagus clarus]